MSQIIITHATMLPGVRQHHSGVTILYFVYRVTTKNLYHSHVHGNCDLKCRLCSSKRRTLIHTHTHMCERRDVCGCVPCVPCQATAAGETDNTAAHRTCSPSPESLHAFFCALMQCSRIGFGLYAPLEQQLKEFGSDYK